MLTRRVPTSKFNTRRSFFNFWPDGRVEFSQVCFNFHNQGGCGLLSGAVGNTPITRGSDVTSTRKENINKSTGKLNGKKTCPNTKGRKIKLIQIKLSSGRRKRGRARRTWYEGIHAAMMKRGMEEGQWEDRNLWKAGTKGELLDKYKLSLRDSGDGAGWDCPYARKLNTGLFYTPQICDEVMMMKRTVNPRTHLNSENEMVIF
ncbi:hypothetical protein C0J52_16625 [Blattella germanica]|nr:hypothetical protein C0J52_16625 [Blattella germanica]